MQRWSVLVLGLALLGLGCAKEESTGPSTPPNYFPLKVGNWWVYTGVRLDTAGAEEPGTEWRDSTAVVAETTLQGRSGYVVVTYRSGSREDTDTAIVASEGGRLYVYWGADDGDDGIPRPTGWVKVADPAMASWRLFDTTLTDVPLDSQTTASGSLRWTGERGGTLVVTVKGRQVTAQEFRMRAQFEGRLRSGGMEVGTLTFTMVEHLWAAEGIGIVRSQQDPPELIIRSPLIPGGELRDKDQGNRGILVDYFVH